MKKHGKTRKDDTPLAGLCFALAITLGLVGLYSLTTFSQYLVVPFVGAALVFVVVGRQQLSKYRLAPERFKIRLRNLSIAVVVATLAALVWANL
ncbi:hypothetical protein [Marinimicrobium sp. ABcell2]|uniref:hypothetical protein n=1 Tax=Marinimicrobium sp. ABcell2 TaxID=3069751 RepID=UPI0027ADF486|nr:hypothetical protein [Marinimicrobium sp. ABcell2]MDQ2077667.1 hypothetical protein [Marinimicrobium sp. ABcell2]